MWMFLFSDKSVIKLSTSSTDNQQCIKTYVAIPLLHQSKVSLSQFPSKRAHWTIKELPSLTLMLLILELYVDQ